MPPGEPAGAAGRSAARPAVPPVEVPDQDDAIQIMGRAAEILRHPEEAEDEDALIEELFGPAVPAVSQQAVPQAGQPGLSARPEEQEVDPEPPPRGDEENQAPPRQGNSGLDDEHVDP